MVAYPAVILFVRVAGAEITVFQVTSPRHDSDGNDSGTCAIRAFLVMMVGSSQGRQASAIPLVMIGRS